MGKQVKPGNAEKPVELTSEYLKKLRNQAIIDDWNSLINTHRSSFVSEKLALKYFLMPETIMQIVYRKKD